MPTKKKLSVKLSPVVATVIRPVAARLNRIEDLLIEMRGVLDFHLKRITALQKQMDILIERIAPLTRSPRRRRRSRHRRRDGSLSLGQSCRTTVSSELWTLSPSL